MGSRRRFALLSSAALLCLVACGSPAENNSANDPARPPGEGGGASLEHTGARPDLAPLIVALMNGDPEDVAFTKVLKRLSDFTCTEWEQFEASITDDQLEVAGAAWSVIETIEESIERDETCPAQALLLARLMRKFSYYRVVGTVSSLLIKFGADVVPELGRLYKTCDNLYRDSSNPRSKAFSGVLFGVPATGDAVREVSRVLPSLTGLGRSVGISWLGDADTKGNAFATTAMRTLLATGTAEARRAFLLVLEAQPYADGAWMKLVAERGQADPDEGLRTLAKAISSGVGSGASLR